MYLCVAKIKRYETKQLENDRIVINNLTPRPHRLMMTTMASSNYQGGTFFKYSQPYFMELDAECNIMTCEANSQPRDYKQHPQCDGKGKIVFIEVIKCKTMDEKKKKELLEGLDEYYAKRRNLDTEINASQKTVEINGFTHIVVDSTIDEWAKSVGAVDIEDIQWQM